MISFLFVLFQPLEQGVRIIALGRCSFNDVEAVLDGNVVGGVRQRSECSGCRHDLSRGVFLRLIDEHPKVLIEVSRKLLLQGPL